MMECTEGALFSSLVMMCLLTVLASAQNENHLLHSHRPKRSTIFFPIDKQDSAPVVNHRRVSPFKNHYRSKRYKRSASNATDWKNDKVIEILPRQMDYDGWQPIDTTDPMSNEPTLVYKPPSLERVHFGKEPPKEKPLYPVVPLNPPVYVIRAEPSKKEVHSIYGTENVDYLHVNPQTDSATAYSAFGGRKNQRRKKERNVSAKRERNPSSFSLSDIIQSFKQRESDANSTARITTRLPSTAISEISSTSTSTTPLTTSTFIPAITTKPSPLPIFTTTPKIVPTASNTTPTENDSALLTTTQFFEESELFNEPEFSKAADYSINLLDTEDVNKTNIFNTEEKDPNFSESQFSEKLLSLDDYFYSKDKEESKNNNPDETQDYDFFSLSESDPFASIIPSKIVEEKEKCDDVRNEEKRRYNPRDIYIAQASENTETRSAKRPSLFERLKNFDGVQFDPYIFSASENNENSFIQKLPPPNFRFREPHSRKFKGPIGRHIELASKETNNRSWYLIETRKPPPKFTNRRKKTEFPSRQNYITGRRSSKYPEDQFIYNPYFEEQFSLLKPSESLTANSLSELLQIFKYVTTPRPVEKFLGSTSFLQKHRIFRYTKPTESPRNAKAFTTFRYTAPFSPTVTSTEASFTGIDSLAIPLKVSNDSVVETNSLDGYLFSASISDPEYRRPDSHHNKIREENFSKNKAFKGDKRDKQHESKMPKEFEREVIQALMIDKKNKPKENTMDKDAVQRGEIAPPFVIQIKENTKDSEDPSPYYIHEGHSKVKVFGLNNEETVLTTTTQAPISSTLGHILISPSTPVKELLTMTASTPTPPKANENTEENSTITSRGVRYYDFNEFHRGVSLDDQVIVNKNVPLWTMQDQGVVSGKQNPNTHSSSFPNTFSTHFSDIQKKTKETTKTNSPPLSSPIEAFSKIFIDYLHNKSHGAHEPTDDATLLNQQEFAHRLDQDVGKSPESDTRTQIEAFLSSPFEYLEYLRMLEKTKTK